LPRRLAVAGIVMTAIGLGLLAYLVPVIRNLFLSGTLTTDTGVSGLTGTQTFHVNFTTGPIVFGNSGSGGTTSLEALATVVVFVGTVIGLLLTIAGSFAGSKPISADPGPGSASSSRSNFPDLGSRNCPREPFNRDGSPRLTNVLRT
jgi:hypothetical protein